MFGVPSQEYTAVLFLELLCVLSLRKTRLSMQNPRQPKWSVTTCDRRQAPRPESKCLSVLPVAGSAEKAQEFQTLLWCSGILEDWADLVLQPRKILLPSVTSILLFIFTS